MQVPDYKAMVGDASDNVPGVTGIGPKNGHSLLASYGSLDGVYSNLTNVNDVVGDMPALGTQSPCA
eukprot:1158286-Pelagomonas_calceolata.AAC.4